MERSILDLREGKVESQSHPAVDQALEPPYSKSPCTLCPRIWGGGKEKENSYQVTIYDPRFRLRNPSLLSTEVEVPKSSVR